MPCCRKIVPRQELNGYAELVMVGEELDREALVAKLNAGGYGRTAIVEEPGDYSVRGGILDVFAPLYPDPLRIELFGDVVESLRFFSPVSQRTSKTLGEAVILPAREVILEKANLDAFIGRVRKRAGSLGLPVTQVRKLVEQIKQEGAFPGIESLISMIYPSLSLFFDYCPDNTVYLLAEPADLEARADNLLAQAEENYQAAVGSGRFCVAPRDHYLDWRAVDRLLESRKVVTTRRLPVSRYAAEGARHPAPCAVVVENSTHVNGLLRAAADREQLLGSLLEWINTHRSARQAVVLACETRLQAERLQALLSPYGVAPGDSGGVPGHDAPPGHGPDLPRRTVRRVCLDG